MYEYTWLSSAFRFKAWFLSLVMSMALGGCGWSTLIEIAPDGGTNNLTVDNPNEDVIDDAGTILDAGVLVVDAGVSTVDGGVENFKWHPGIYVKIEDWQLKSKPQMEAIYSELTNTPQLRGIRVTVLWGRYETRDTVTNRSQFNFEQIDQILNRLSTLDDKHLILSFAWREFKSVNGASDILPNDLRQGALWTVDSSWVHTKYDWLWAYRMSRKPGQYGYNLKLWSATLRSRMDAFLAAMGKHLSQHPNLTVVSTTESASGEPVVPFGVGEGESQQFQGQIEVIRMLRAHFPNCLTIPDLNYSQQHVANVVALMENERIGLGSSNSNLAQGLNRTSSPPGVLTYYPKLSGSVALAPEIQGDDYQNSNSDDAIPDYPTYEDLYLRVRNVLQANYTVMQRNTPFWLGDNTTPSMLKFIQTYPLIVNDATGAGGLDSVRPKNLKP